MKSPSLAKTLGLKEINWREVLLRAAVGKLSDTEIAFYKEKLLEWTTCPCGNLSVCIPRNTYKDDDKEDYRPYDHTLAELGTSVYQEFRDENYESAFNIFEMIQIRAKFVIEQEEAALEKEIAKLVKATQEVRQKLKKVKLAL